MMILFGFLLEEFLLRELGLLLNEQSYFNLWAEKNPILGSLFIQFQQSLSNPGP